MFLLRTTYSLLLACILFLQCQCSTGRSKPTDKESDPTTRQQIIGTITWIHPELNYVILRAEQGIILPAGLKVHAHSALGTQSELSISSERKAQLVTADIVSGTPSVGDWVTVSAAAVNPPSAGSSTDSASPNAPSNETELPFFDPSPSASDP